MSSTTKVAFASDATDIEFLNMHGENEVDSVTAKRQRTRSTIAKERDQMMIEEEAQAGFCKRYKSFVKIIPYIMLQGISTMFVQPLMPKISKDYFGSDAKAAEITSYIAAVTAFIGMFTCSFYGKLLDTVGRKPFFVLAPLFQLAIPNLLLVIFRETPIIYLLAGALGNLIQFSYLTSYIADNFSTQSRVKVFAAQQAVGSLTAFFALFVGVFDDTMLIIIACILSFITVAYAFFFIDESIPEDVRQPFSKDMCMGNPFSAMTFLLESKLCRAVIAIVACFIFGEVGTGDIYMYYLNDKVGFDSTDNAILFAQAGLLEPIIMLVLLPALSIRFSSTQIIFFSLIVLLIELTLLAVVWAKWAVFAFIVPVVGLAGLMVPVLLSVLSNAGNPADQGRRLTGFAALVDLCSALGPLMFGAVYGNVSDKLKFLPFVIAAVISLPAFYVVKFLPQYIKEDNEEREAKAAEAVSRGRSASTVNSLMRFKHDDSNSVAVDCDACDAA